MLAWRGVGFGATGPQESCGVRGDLRVTLLALLRVSKQVVPALNLALSNFRRPLYFLALPPQCRSYTAFIGKQGVGLVLLHSNV